SGRSSRFGPLDQPCPTGSPLSGPGTRESVVVTDEVMERDARLATVRLVMFSAFLAIGAAALWAGSLRFTGPLDGAPVHVSWIVLALAFAVTELVSVHIESRGEAHALTFSEIPLVVGLILSTPEETIAAR